MRYDIADKLHMPVDCSDFKVILKNWPHEPWTSWSEDEPTEAKSRGAKLDKYNVDMKNLQGYC